MSKFHNAEFFDSERKIFVIPSKELYVPSISLDNFTLLKWDLLNPVVSLRISVVETVDYGPCYLIKIEWARDSPKIDFHVIFFGDAEDGNAAERICGINCHFLDKVDTKHEAILPCHLFLGWKTIIVNAEREILNPSKSKYKQHKTQPSFIPSAPFDLTLQNKYGAHRQVLMDASPVFKAMFTVDMQEKQLKNVNIFPEGQYSDSALKTLICFLYFEDVQYIDMGRINEILTEIQDRANPTEKLQLDTTFEQLEKVNCGFIQRDKDCSIQKNTVTTMSVGKDELKAEILELAHRFQLPSMLKRVERTIMASLSFNNVEKFYNLANLYDLPCLQRSCAILTCHLATLHMYNPTLRNLNELSAENKAKKRRKGEEKDGIETEEKEEDVEGEGKEEEEYIVNHEIVCKFLNVFVD